ncbi:sodium/potassium/calcium exchanger 5-like [Arctopsyche grandis]|uniref:sodium/potassium/calcium exchanger 5-like n=1 Tax=Arctopsyche grandis TaxID=121162 RepID=UPI00406D9000
MVVKISWMTLLVLTICLVVVRTLNFSDFDSEIRPQARYSHKALNYSHRLLEVLIEEEDLWHSLPWHHVRTELVGRTLDVQECVNKTEESFPPDLFTDEELRQGAIVLHFIAVIYCFTLLAIVCDEYFIPSVEFICEDLKISKDVAAATFMATATSCPELFVNVMGTFVTKSDLGIGTIVGSALFNTLGVAAVGSFSAPYPLKILRWPVSRDCIIYIFNVIVLIIIVWDDRIMWWETCILMVLYVSYFIIIFNSPRLERFLRRNCCSKDTQEDTHIIQGDSETGTSNESNGFEMSEHARQTNGKPEIATLEKVEKIDKMAEIQNEKALEVDEEQKVDLPVNLFKFPCDESLANKIWYVYTWPINVILTCTIPSPKRWRFIYPLSFFMCIIIIGINSYFVSWMISTIGDVLTIPDSIMGMTFLAFGGCLPEAFSIYIVARKGKGDMGISNAIGANSLAILFSLSVPWFIKSIIQKSHGEDPFIEIESGGMNYIIISIVFAVIAMYIVLTVSKFQLRVATGIATGLIYLIFVTFAILMEAGVFFQVVLPPCPK